MPSPLRTGLVSVTFRQRSVAQIISDVAKAGLQAIEWGGDVHVPPGDLPHAAEVRRQTAEAGLAVSSYGSYYNATKDPADLAGRVLATAAELGAPTVRMWAGPMDSTKPRTTTTPGSPRISSASPISPSRWACRSRSNTTAARSPIRCRAR
ncbi:MAG: hypothetical protein QM754_01080 [Tepidisphaeraceae bacterium]